MRISIVTVCYNAAETIAETLRSVGKQQHADVEHIVIDGGSSDATAEIVRRYGGHVACFVSEPDRGIYDGMNKGLARATGNVVAFLNADDVYTSPIVLNRVAEVFRDPAIDACHANLIYVDRQNASQVVRVWRSRPFSPGFFARGWMPAHPTLFVRRRIFEELGTFDLKFKRQSDFDLMMRFFEVGRVRSRFVPEYWVRMRSGGTSNGSIRGILLGNYEAWRICRKNKVRIPPWFVVTKVGSRLGQFWAARTIGPQERAAARSSFD